MKNTIQVLGLFIFTLLPLINLSAQWTLKNNIPGLAIIQFNTVGDPSTVDVPSFHTYAILHDSLKMTTSTYVNGYDLYVCEDISYNWSKLTNPSISSALIPSIDLDFYQIDFELENNSDGNIGFAINSHRSISLSSKSDIVQIYLHKTSNGGQSWKRIPIDSALKLSSGYDIITAMDFIDTLNGYVNICKNDSLSTKNSNTVYKTIDGGKTWNPVLFIGQTLNEPLSMDFYDENNGIIVGYDGTSDFNLYQYSTSDGGQKWHNSGGPNMASKYRNYYGKQVSQNTAYFLDSDNYNSNSILAKSLDSGFSWDTIKVTGADSSVYIMGMNFLDDSYGYVYLSNGHLKVTADGGNFWTTSDTIALDKGFNPQNSTFLGVDLNVTQFGGWELGSITAKGINSYAVKDIILSIHETNAESYSIYPNPLLPGQTLHLAFDYIGKRNISLVDISGKTILNKVSNNISANIELPVTISKGTYFIQVNNNNVLSTKKILLK